MPLVQRPKTPAETRDEQRERLTREVDARRQEYLALRHDYAELSFLVRVLDPTTEAGSRCLEGASEVSAKVLEACSAYEDALLRLSDFAVERVMRRNDCGD
jgi:hypothetical protein